MINRFTGLAPAARLLAIGPVARFGTQRITLRSIFTTAQHALTIFGVTAIVTIAVLYARPDLARNLSRALAEEPAPAVPVAEVVVAPKLHQLMEAPAVATAERPTLSPAEEKALLGTRKQQQWVTDWLSKRYRVAGDAANMLVSTAYMTAREIKLDPLLILAVMAIESRFNPFAESPVGAQGLMQVMSKVHHEKFQELGGVQAALNPVANIRVGSLILKDYVTRGGSVEAGLKSYVGAGAFATDDGYGSRVLAEYQRLKQVSAGKKVPTFTPTPAPAVPVAPAVPATVTAKSEPEPEEPKSEPEQLAGL
ncbi:transglycosylase SLT domain-containing protein [Pseudoduganella chitinolytica]|uniref:Transglycosylase SLT domain-containing protein n=1 Tax=Pseudoduganella chitinolytica TaxID=34070 RepID=A0ABY8BHT5_9BURK|nr:transglycosylase SLT domain-containing protein [Pseudoduganella chitinolytica]WEF35487.1 transglycosylase SLT domain-containing protein [Pseudoduganella chitinolytica]